MTFPYDYKPLVEIMYLFNIRVLDNRPIIQRWQRPRPVLTGAAVTAPRRDADQTVLLLSRIISTDSEAVSSLRNTSVFTTCYLLYTSGVGQMSVGH